MQAAQLDRTYRALSDPSRRAMLQHLARSRSLTVSEIAAPLPLALPTVLKHLAVLERATLVRRQKIGRTVNVTLEANAMAEAIAWLERTEAVWTGRLDRLTQLVEVEFSKSQSNPGKTTP